MNRRIPVLLLIIALLSACRPAVPAGHYDLVADSVNMAPKVAHVGDSLFFEYAVRNDGADTVPGKAFSIDLYVDGERLSFDHGTARLGPGLFTRYSHAGPFKPAKAGAVRYRLVIEADTVPERNKANNVLEGVIEILP